MTVREGPDVGIIASGYPVALAVEAAEELAKEGVDVEVLDIHTIKPIDRAWTVKIAKRTGTIVTVVRTSLVNPHLIMVSFWKRMG